MSAGTPARASLVALAVLVAGCVSVAAQDDLTAFLEWHRKLGKVPSLSAAVAVRGKVIASGAAGVRRAESSVPVTRDDKYHAGSVTKPMTATLAAMLVEEGKLRWDSTIGEVLRGYDMQSKFRDVTLAELLSHQSGLIGSQLSDTAVWRNAKTRSGSVMAVRKWFVEEVLKMNTSGSRGSFSYSNAGYVVAGHMMEVVTGRSWEDVMRERLFLPLGMTTAGFGPPATPGQTDQPWVHGLDGKSIAPGPNADNPPALGPASSAHASTTPEPGYQQT